MEEYVPRSSFNLSSSTGEQQNLGLSWGTNFCGFWRIWNRAETGKWSEMSESSTSFLMEDSDEKILSINVASWFEILVGMFIQGANPCEISKDKRLEACLDDDFVRSRLKSPINITSYFSAKTFLSTSSNVSRNSVTDPLGERYTSQIITLSLALIGISIKSDSNIFSLFMHKSCLSTAWTLFWV